MTPLTKSDRIINIIVSVLFVFVLFITVYPLWYVMINSISSSSAVSQGVYFWPREVTLQNYREVFAIPLVFTGMRVSAMRAIIGSALSVFCSSLLAYLLTNPDLPLRKTIYRLCVATMYVSSGIIPWYITMVKLGLKNNFLLYVLPTAVSGYYLILIKTYIESIPRELGESAELDGAGIMTLFFRIILPLSKPIIACIVVFSAVNQWNSWMDNMFLVTDRNLQTLQYLLYSTIQSKGIASALQQGESIKPLALRLTMTFVTVAPILLVYPFMQRFFVKGIMLGAVKG